MIKHIAFIMDGNRRYSKKNNSSINQGYLKGLNKLIEFIKYQIKYQIHETSFFALSTDNYKKRPIEEKKIIYNLIKEFSLNKEIEELFTKNKIKINLKGDIQEIKDKEKKVSMENRFFINKIEKKFESWNQKNQEHEYIVNLCINYDGQKEILHSFKQILKLINENKINTKDISEETIKNNLYFHSSPPPEIIVRPGNAPRISGFLLWDSKYSEIYLTKKYWPELNEQDFKEIIEWYSGQKRNFGK